MCTFKIRTFIASPEYCIESTRIQYTQKDLTIIWIHKQQLTQCSTKLPNFKNSKYQNSTGAVEAVSCNR